MPDSVDLRSDIEGLLRNFLGETGATLTRSVEDVAAYAVARAQFLAQIAAAGEPGFWDAAKRERDSTLIYAGIAAVADAKVIEERAHGFGQALLLLGVRLLGAALPA